MEHHHKSIDWFKGNITRNSHISWENHGKSGWFPVSIFPQVIPLHKWIWGFPLKCCSEKVEDGNLQWVTTQVNFRIELDVENQL